MAEKTKIDEIGIRPTGAGSKLREATQGTPEEAGKLVAAYAKLHNMTESASQAYLIYVGYNRRAALERYEPAAKKPKKEKKTHAKTKKPRAKKAADQKAA